MTLGLFAFLMQVLSLTRSCWQRKVLKALSDTSVLKYPTNSFLS